MRLLFRGLAEQVRQALGGLVVVRGVGDADVAVVEDRLIRSVRLLQLVERLRDEQSLEPVAGHERQPALEEFEPAERREFVEQKEQPMLVGRSAADLQGLGQAAADLVQHQADDGAGARQIARRHDQIQAHRGLGVHQIGDAKVACGRVSGDDRIAVEAETRQGRREDAREFVVALAQHLARGLGDGGMGRIAEVPGLEHPLERLRLGGVRVGQEPGDAGQRLVALGVEDMQDGAGEQAVGGRLPVVARVLLAGGVDEDIGDVLGIAHLVPTFADFQERIEAERIEGRRLEAPDVAELAAPARGERPIFSLDVVDEDRVRPAEERRDDQADALARSGGGEAEDVLGAVMADEAARFAERWSSFGRRRRPCVERRRRSSGRGRRRHRARVPRVASRSSWPSENSRASDSGRWACGIRPRGRRPRSRRARRSS